MPAAHDVVRRLVGLSFTVEDLVLLRAWAEAQHLDVVVRLDHGSDSEEYEETVAFSAAGATACRWVMWRSRDAVFVQPLIGRPHRYADVAAAIAALSPEPAAALSDIFAHQWPSA